MSLPVDIGVRLRASEILDDIEAKADGVVPCRKRDPKSYIYFVRCGDLVKIGTTVNPHRRLEALQTGNAGTLELMRLEYGDTTREGRYHMRFAAQRARGEWFRYEGALRAFLEAV